MAKKCILKFADSLLSKASAITAFVCRSYPVSTFQKTKANQGRPIVTYRRSGTIHRPDAKHHSVAYSSEEEPPPVLGKNLTRRAIKVVPRFGEYLEPLSRINFSAVYTVEYKIKVSNIGAVREPWLGWVQDYVRQSSGIS